MSTTALPTVFRHRLADAPEAARPRLLVEFIVSQLRDALGMDASDEFHARSRFTDLGVDSKRALEFKEFLEDELQCPLRTTLLFDYPTPESLAAYILKTAFATAASEPDGAPDVSASAAPEPAKESSDRGDVEEQLRKKLEKYGI